MGTVMNAIDRRKELILDRERDFAKAIGAAIFEKPIVSFWMIMIPLLFIYFIYRMLKYKEGRIKFDEEFMATRSRALEVAVEAVETGTRSDCRTVRSISGLVPVATASTATSKARLRAAMNSSSNLIRPSLYFCIRKMK